MDEIWRNIPSVPSMEASSWGRVRIKPYSIPMPGGRGIKNITPKPRFGTEQKSATGRPGVPKRRMIHVLGLEKAFIVSRLVCEAFHGPAPFDGAMALHKDEDPSNNTPSNLEWGTAKKNQNAPLLKAWQKSRVGAESPRAKWKAAQA